MYGMRSQIRNGRNSRLHHTPVAVHAKSVAMHLGWALRSMMSLSRGQEYGGVSGWKYDLV